MTLAIILVAISAAAFFGFRRTLGSNPVDSGFRNKRTDDISDQAAQATAAHDANSHSSQSLLSRLSTTARHQTGDEIEAVPRMHGRGTLSLINGSGEDAVVLIFSSRNGELARSAYIRAGETANLADVSPGRYWVRATQGDQWDDSMRSFLQDASYFAFPHPYSFSEEKREDGVIYDKISLTLNVVPNGNVEKQPINREEFWGNAPTG